MSSASESVVEFSLSCGVTSPSEPLSERSLPDRELGPFPSEDMSSRTRLGGLESDRDFAVGFVVLSLLLASLEGGDDRLAVLSSLGLDGDLDEGVGEGE